MKTKVLLAVVLVLFMSAGCKLVKNLTDVTASADQILKDIDELVRLVDVKVESGDLTREMGDLVDQRIETLKSAIEDIIEKTGGKLYDVVNGSINNIFANISGLLGQIKTGILDDSLPNLIDAISGELQLQISLISSSVEDVVVLTFGNAFILVDKLANSIIVIISVVLLALGLLIFGIILIRQKGRPEGIRLMGVIFMAVYVLFFLGLILITPLRAFIFSGMGFGKKVTGQDFPPKIVGVNPQKFTVGKSDRIFIYGNHLDKIAQTGVYFYRGQEKVFTFPAENIIVNTRNRIVLGNFKGNLHWVVPPYDRFRDAVIGPGASVSRVHQFEALSEDIQDLLYPGQVMRPVNHIGPVIPLPIHDGIQAQIAPLNVTVGQPLRRSMRAFPATAIGFRDLSERSRGAYQSIFGGAQAGNIEREVNQFFMNTFQLPEGDFGVHVYDGQNEIASPQFMTVYYPPLPPPKPDIDPISMNWTNGAPAIKNQNTSLTLRIGFRHPEQVQNPFSVRITSTPPSSTIILNVSMADIAAAGVNNFVDVISSPLSFSQSTTYTFNVQADSNNNVAESNESNNVLTQTLHVSEYVYDTTVQIMDFESRDDMDSHDGDDYRIEVRVDVTGFPRWQFHYDKEGEPGHLYNIGRQNSYSSLKPGDNITISTTGYESDSGLYDGDDDMGWASLLKTLGNQPTQGQESFEISYRLTAQKYFLGVKIRFARRVA